jgi:peptidoglycan hydrolase-like protein with peptidoglycan-binding domain
MQHDNFELRAQQLVLAFLGFYNGDIDGIWSNATIRAMKAFECDDKFLPAVPTQGLPFRLNCRLPKGMYWDKRLVAHRDLTPDAIKALLDKRTPRKVETQPAKTEPEVQPVVEESEAPVTQSQDSTKGAKNAQK